MKSLEINDNLSESHVTFINRLEDAGLDSKILRGVIESPCNHKARRIVDYLRNQQDPFKLPAPPEDVIESFKVFYAFFFDITVADHDIVVPEHIPEGYRLWYSAPGLIEKTVVDACRQYRIVDLETSRFDFTNSRNLKSGGTVLIQNWLTNNQGLDREPLKELMSKNDTLLTVLELMLVMLYDFWRTGEFRAPFYETLCAGSYEHTGSTFVAKNCDGDGLYVYEIGCSGFADRLFVPVYVHEVN